jgi:hypothetical protein
MSLTLLTIDIGDLANDGTGDPLRVAFEKINNNFSTISLLNSGGVEGSVQFKVGNTYSGSVNLIFESSANILKLDGSLVSNTVGNLVIGSANNKVSQLFVSATGFNLGNITFIEDGNIIYFPTTVDNNVFSSLAGIQDLSINGNAVIAKSLIVGAASLTSAILTKQTVLYSTINNTPNQEIFTLPITQLSAGTFRINSVENNSFNQQSVIIEATKRPGGASANFVAYGTRFVGTPITRYNVDVAYGNLRVLVSPIPNSTITHKIYMELEG